MFSLEGSVAEEPQEPVGEPRVRQADGWMERWFARRTSRLLARTDEGGGRCDLGAAGAVGVAVAVLAVPHALLGAAGWLVIVGTGFVTWAVAGLLVLVAVALRPRLPRLDRDADVVARADAPELYRFFDQVADAVGARRADLIVVDREFNASYGRVGARRRVVVTVGLPLWSVLPDEQKIALISHEFAHGRNGDARRGLLVGSARHTLRTLHYLLGGYEGDETGLMTSANLLLRPLFALLRGLVRVAAVALELLALPSGRRAEYRADVLAAGVASPPAMIGLLDSLEALAPLYSFVLATPAVTLAAGTDPLTRLANLATETPEGHRTEASETSVDDSHPPTRLRRAQLAALPPSAPLLALTADFTGELSPYARRIARSLH
ncbi:hypothetical protein GCM10027589_11200 [Actinocorallia lasiicapitis]